MKKVLAGSLLVTCITSSLFAGNYSHESVVFSSMGGASTGGESTNLSVVGETFVNNVSSGEAFSTKSGFLMRSSVLTAAPSSAGVALDLNYITRDYDQDVITDKDIEMSEFVDTNIERWVAVVAQNVSNLDTYQVELLFDSTRLEFLAATEEDAMGGIYNLLKKNSGTTVGFQAVLTEEGIINISNALTGSDSAIAPEGTGLIALLKFKILDGDVNNTIELQNVHFVNSSGNNELITNHMNVVFNPEATVQDSDGDGVPDDEDAFPNDPNEWLDTDGDGTGNNEDLDDDNDGIPDEYEIANGLDPLDDSDASEDTDGDGYSNLEEYEAGTDPQVSFLYLDIVGKTKYFTNTKGNIGVRSFDDEGIYIGSVSSKDGTTFGIDGVYEIVGKVLTLERISPELATYTLTYLDEKSGVMNFTLVEEEKAEEKSYFYNTVEERDASTQKVNPAIIMYLLN